jgi:flagellar basal-body rod protein FlgG
VSTGQNIYQSSPTSGEPTTEFPQVEGMGRLQQGYLESSNVEIMQEMVDMITAMRAYEINSKAIKNSETMADISNNLVR